MRVSNFLPRAVRRGKKKGRPYTSYRAYRREEAKVTYRNAKRTLEPEARP